MQWRPSDLMAFISRALLGLIALTLGVFGPYNAVGGNTNSIVIGGGIPFGYYFGLAGALCKVINEQVVNEKVPRGIHCLNLAAGSSARNLLNIDEEMIDFAVVQSDWLRHAVEGTSRYRGVGPNEAYRSIFSVPAESLTILSRGDVRTKVLGQLADRRVGYDTSNPYAYLLMQNAIEAARINLVSATLDAKVGSAADHVCAGKIDAYVTMTRHPDGHAVEMLSNCELKYVTLNNSIVEAVVEKHSELIVQRIKHLGAGGKQQVFSTFGLTAVLVTSRDTTDAVVDQLLEATFGKLGKPETGKPPFSKITKKVLMAAARIAPMHERAEAYFKARGWLD